MTCSETCPGQQQHSTAASSTFPSTLPALIYNFLHFLMPRLPRAGRNNQRERGEGDCWAGHVSVLYFWQHIISFICRQNAFRNQISAKTFSICDQQKNGNMLEKEKRERKEKGTNLSINLFCFAEFQFAKAKVENNMENES